MNTQLTYRGLAYQPTEAKASQSNQEITYRGRQAKSYRPAKLNISLRADMQFFGRHVIAVTPDNNLFLGLHECATA